MDYQQEIERRRIEHRKLNERRRRIYGEIGKRFRRVREYRGYSQTELAAVLETSPAVISNFEQGKRGVSLHLFAELAECVGVSVGALFGESPLPIPENGEVCDVEESDST